VILAGGGVKHGQYLVPFLGIPGGTVISGTVAERTAFSILKDSLIFAHRVELLTGERTNNWSGVELGHLCRYA
jgi:hypothetical protein